MKKGLFFFSLLLNLSLYAETFSCTEENGAGRMKMTFQDCHQGFSERDCSVDLLWQKDPQSIPEVYLGESREREWYGDIMMGGTHEIAFDGEILLRSSYRCKFDAESCERKMNRFRSKEGAFFDCQRVVVPKL